MHKAKNEKETKKTKDHYGIPALAATIHPPSRQHLNSRHSKSDASEKGIEHKRLSHPIKDIRFSL
jgi:hypothetical protein